jgi:hypothetical protein
MLTEQDKVEIGVGRVGHWNDDTSDINRTNKPVFTTATSKRFKTRPPVPAHRPKQLGIDDDMFGAEERVGDFEDVLDDTKPCPVLKPPRRRHALWIVRFAVVTIYGYRGSKS